jgi:2-polyprenyl-6-methoxyphenol hydroxylase-like FAD-dependent oxidoreductase
MFAERACASTSCKRAFSFSPSRATSNARRALVKRFALPPRPDGSSFWSDKKVAVIGGGPSGLATALALRAKGIDGVRVFERTEAIKPNVGGGFNLNGGARVLCELGLEATYDALANDLLGVKARRANGGFGLFEVRVHDMIRGDDDGCEALVSESGRVLAGTVQRADLQRAMADALPSECLMFDRGVKAVQSRGSNAEIEFENGDREVFDLVIGADGIDSRAREAVDGGESPPKYSGIRIVFGCTPAGSTARAASEMNIAHQWFADGAYMLVFTGGGEGAQNKQHNIALCVQDKTKRDENTAWRAKAAAKEEAVALMREKGMPQSAIDVAEACDRFFDVGVHYHDVLDSWSDDAGTISLVGDACHAMPPFLGQGANQAMQDALCIASELSKVGAEYDTVKQALRAYEGIRKPPTAAIMQSSRFIGALETGAGPVSLFRDVAFFMAGTLGITGKVFLSGALPRFEGKA